jgi:hypothetical protein
MKSTVYFVGMHNKPGMKPLDSTTRTGTIIDKIIKGLSDDAALCVKTNLCDMERVAQNSSELQVHRDWWHERFDVKPKDVVVLLGDWVHKAFDCRNLRIVKLRHPARAGKNYSNEAVALIKKALS